VPLAVLSKLHGGLPDAVGFGFFASAGVQTLSHPGLIGGGEIIIAPRLKEAALFAFGGYEGSGSISSVLSHPESLFHAEGGVFEAWYWNVATLNSDAFWLYGLSQGGRFVGGSWNEFLYGVTTDEELSYFGIAGYSTLKYGPVHMSEAQIATYASLLQSVVTTSLFIRSGIDNVTAIAAGIITGSIGLSAWVGLTYGKATS